MAHDRENPTGGLRWTAAEIVRNFAEARELARSQPLMITNHGRETHVLMSIADFNASQIERSGIDVSNPLFELGEWMPDAALVFDRDLRIGFANRVAASVIRMSQEELRGTLFADLPGVAGSHLHSIVERTNATNEFSTLQLQSPFAGQNWVEVRSFPWRERNILFMRDISERAEAQKLADAKRAILQAMNEHGKIGYVRLSLRGTIESTDEPFNEMVGLAGSKLVGVPLINLVPQASRVALREAIEEVITQGVRRRLDLRIVANGNESMEATVALAPLVGSRGIEGAVVIMTSCPE